MRQCGAKTLVHCTSRLPAAALRLQLNRILLRSDLSANDTALPSVRELPAKLENLLARVSSITVWRRPGVWIDFPLARIRKAEGLACLVVGVPLPWIIQDNPHPLTQNPRIEFCRLHLVGALSRRVSCSIRVNHRAAFRCFGCWLHDGLSGARCWRFHGCGH